MKTCLFTVSFAGFWGQHRLSLAESIDKAAELGFDGVEIMAKRPHLSPLDWSVDDCKRLRDQLAERGLACAALAGYTSFTAGASAAEVPLVEMQIDYVGQLAERAKALDCDLVRIFASYERDDQPVTDQWRRTVAAIRECCDRAGAHGVTVGVQNHHDLGVCARTMLELLHEVDRPNCIPMYDCWSSYLLDEDLAAAVAAMAGVMRFTTAADYVILPRGKLRRGPGSYETLEPPLLMAAAMGEGDLDYQTFFDTLAAEGFDGWVSYEMCWPLREGGELPNLERCARKFLEYMKPWTG